MPIEIILREKVILTFSFSKLIEKNPKISEIESTSYRLVDSRMVNIKIYRKCHMVIAYCVFKHYIYIWKDRIHYISNEPS